MKYITIFLLCLLACSDPQDEALQQPNLEDEPVVTLPLDTIEMQEDTRSVATVRTVSDYYHLLPDWLFMCDGMGDEDSPEFRDNAITEKDLANGYIKSNPMGIYNLEVALFKNREANTDHIMAVINCGMGCMCNHIEFYSVDADGNLFEDRSLLPDDDKILQGYYALIVPRHGTTISAYDFEAWDNPEADVSELFLLEWQNGKFVKVDPYQ